MPIAIPTCARDENGFARIADIVTRHERELVAAIDEDFGHRSRHETRLAELYIVAAEARLAMRRLPRWMKPRRVATPWHLLPASARVVRQPLGVAGVISPWNYPVQLALAPVVAALAAGNRVTAEAVGADAGDVGAARASSSPNAFATTSSASCRATRTSGRRSHRCRSTICSSPDRRPWAGVSRWRRPKTSRR